jgi:hypothetical protein
MLEAQAFKWVRFRFYVGPQSDLFASFGPSTIPYRYTMTVITAADGRYCRLDLRDNVCLPLDNVYNGQATVMLPDFKGTTVLGILFFGMMLVALCTSPASLLIMSDPSSALCLPHFRRTEMIGLP